MQDHEKTEDQLIDELNEMRRRTAEFQVTEAKALRTDRALEDSEDHFRPMFEKHSAVMLLIEPMTGEIMDANNAAQRFYGYTLSQFRSMSIQDINMLTPEEVTHERILAIQEKQNPFIVAHRLSNGEVRTVEVHSTPIERGEKKILFSIIHDITERRAYEKALREKTHELEERIRELNCLFGISKIIENRDLSLDETFQGVLDLIPQGWQYPRITSATIILQDREFKTESFAAPVSKQSADIIVYGKISGILEVGYLEEPPVIDEGPFLKEERDLIDTIAARLGRILERNHAVEQLNESRQFSDQLLDAQLDTVFVFDPVTQEPLKWNKAFRAVSGYSDEEIEAMKAPLHYYGNEDLKLLADAAETVITTGKVKVEASLITKDD
ncbi:MAG: PAS domain S-box protein, partial [Desulfomonile sp.]